MAIEAQAGAASVIEKGVTGYLKGITSRDEVAARRAKDRESLASSEYREKTGAVQQQIDTLNKKNKLLEDKAMKAASFNYMERYMADGNPRHFNNMLSEIPELVQITGIQQAMLVDPYSPEDEKLIVEAGAIPEQFYKPDEMDDTEDAEIRRNTRQRFIKTQRTDGTWGITDIEKVIAGTGYLKFAADEEIKRTMKKMKVARSAGGGNEGPMVRDAKAMARAEKRIEVGEGTAEDRRIVDFGKHKMSGVKAGQATLAEEATVELTESFGGEDKFFETDFSDAKNFRKAWPKINRIQKLTDKFTSKERAEINSIRSMISLGDPAGKITEKETGILDNMLSNVKKYIFSEVGGTAAKSAYAAFRNATRHALYGAALTEAEITSFNEAFGTLGQKLAPVLEQFKTGLMQVKAKLDSIANLNDPYVTYVLLGADQRQMDEMLTAIDQRIALIDDASPQAQAAAPRKSLQDRVKAIQETRANVN